MLQRRDPDNVLHSNAIVDQRRRLLHQSTITPPSQHIQVIEIDSESSDAEEETTSSGRRAQLGKNPFVLQAAISAAANAAGKEDEDEILESMGSDAESEEDIESTSQTYDASGQFNTAGSQLGTHSQAPAVHTSAILPHTDTPLPSSTPIQLRCTGNPTHLTRNAPLLGSSQSSEENNITGEMQVDPVHRSPTYSLPADSPTLHVGAERGFRWPPMQRGLADGQGGQWEDDFFQQQSEVRHDIADIGSTLRVISEAMQNMRQLRHLPQVVVGQTHVLERMEKTWSDMISIQKAESERHHTLAMKMLEAMMNLNQPHTSRVSDVGELSHRPASHTTQPLVSTMTQTQSTFQEQSLTDHTHSPSTHQHILTIQAHSTPDHAEPLTVQSQSLQVYEQTLPAQIPSTPVHVHTLPVHTTPTPVHEQTLPVQTQPITVQPQSTTVHAQPITVPTTNTPVPEQTLPEQAPSKSPQSQSLHEQAPSTSPQAQSLPVHAPSTSTQHQSLPVPPPPRGTQQDVVMPAARRSRKKTTSDWPDPPILRSRTKKS